nr:MAG TPA: minor tail protein Z [Caudoviricetes sp.]
MIEINLDGLVALEAMLKAYPARTRQAASLAINQTAKREALINIRRDMIRQINWKMSYLQDKTGVKRLAYPNRLSATLFGRDQPTMLNRFRANPDSLPKRQKRGKNTGVRVKVKPHSPKVMRGAFVYQFKKNKAIGILMRTKGGISEPPMGVTNGGGRYISSMRAWLLYAPSIDQVMWDTAEQNRARIEKYLVSEFLRQFNRLNKL